jgi:RNA polymerase sigma factor (sigma-70 family)
VRWVNAHKARVAPTTDEELMRRVGAGDVRAFELIYDRHNRQVFALARRITGQIGAAEEATQDAFMSLWRSPGSYDASRASLRSWLLTIVRNRSIDFLRRGTHRARHQAVAEDLAEQLEAPERTEETVIAMHDDVAVRRLLADLPPEQREVIELAYFAGYTQSEIAARVGVSIGTVKSRARLGLVKLRREVVLA